MTTALKVQFILVFLLSTVLHEISASRKCKAICFIDANKRLLCKSLRTMTSDDTRDSQPITCLKNEYYSSTEIILGSFEPIEGIKPGGLDVLSTDEVSAPSNLQLTIKMKIEYLHAGIFEKLNNLQKLVIYPKRVSPCVFFNLPKSLRNVLLQCVSSKLRMVDDMFWPSDSKVEFKLNMCQQTVSCYACQPTSSTPFKSVLLKSVYPSQRLASNKVISLTSCEPKRCNPEANICVPAKSTTTSTTVAPTTTTIVAAPVPTTKPVSSGEKEKPKSAGTSKSSSKNDKVSAINTSYLASKDATERDESSSTNTKSDMLVLVLLGATGLNTIILLVLVCLILHASGCCRKKKQRGVFLMSKGNYPPEYSTLRPV